VSLPGPKNAAKKKLALGLSEQKPWMPCAPADQGGGRPWQQGAPVGKESPMQKNEMPCRARKVIHNPQVVDLVKGLKKRRQNTAAKSGRGQGKKKRKVDA